MSEFELIDDDLVDEVGLENLEFAGFWSRVGASLIDTLIVAPFIVLMYYNFLLI